MSWSTFSVRLTLREALSRDRAARNFGCEHLPRSPSSSLSGRIEHAQLYISTNMAGMIDTTVASISLHRISHSYDE